MSLLETAIPAGSQQALRLPGAHFADCYCLPDPTPEAPALQTWLDLVGRTPGWVDALMALRNRLVRLAGLKDLGALGGPARLRRPAAHYRVGDRVGIFVIRYLSATEVVMGQDDRHLDVQVALLRHTGPEGQPVLSLSTVVHEHNPLGHAYMALVRPFHRRIVRAMLARWARPAPGVPHG